MKRVPGPAHQRGMAYLVLQIGVIAIPDPIVARVLAARYGDTVATIEKGWLGILCSTRLGDGCYVHNPPEDIGAAVLMSY